MRPGPFQARSARFWGVVPIVPLDDRIRIVHRPLAQHALGRRIAAMPVNQQDPPEAGAANAIEHIANQREVGLNAQGHRAGKGRPLLRQAVRDGRVNRHAGHLSNFPRQARGQDGVDAQAEIGVLFGAAGRQDASIIVFQVGFNLHPIHFGDLHGSQFLCLAALQYAPFSSGCGLTSPIPPAPISCPESFRHNARIRRVSSAHQPVRSRVDNGRRS